MSMRCPRCSTANPDVARFCGNCGLGLKLGPGGMLGAGQAPHPEPLAPPDGFLPVGWATNLYYCSEAAGGGPPLLGTEALELSVFNGGYSLAQVVLRVSGEGESGQPSFVVNRDIEEWRRGEMTRLEIPSYELPGPVAAVNVEFVQAEFARED
jgi:hypothetical protein